MSDSINLLNGIFSLNTRLFNNCLKGVTDEIADQKVSDHNNSFLWVATHTVWARYNILAFAGKPAENPYKGMFEGFKPAHENDSYPTLEEIKTEWQKVSAMLTPALLEMSDEHLAAESNFKSPIGDSTIAGALAFLAQHESYDIGQLGYLKKYLTKEAMAYS